MMSLSKRDPVLASRRKGERLRELVEAEAGVAPLVVLDFEDADIVTPSFFLGAVWPLWERAHVEQCPVVANLPPSSVDDLDLVTKLKRTPMWTGRYAAGRFSKPELLGELEMASQDAAILEQIFQRGAVSAAELVDLVGEMGLTGWNNRLAALWQKKLLSRRKVGRTYLYSVPWKGSGHVDRTAT